MGLSLRSSSLYSPLMKSIVFMGTPEFALTHLKAIHQYFPAHRLLVFSRPDAPKGRGKQMMASPVKQWAIEMGLLVFTPASKQELDQQVSELNPDIIFVVAYGMILPKTLTDRYFCVNVHGSLLPKYRGASPIQTALLNNDTETGVTLIAMNEKMDEGDVLSHATLKLDSDDCFLQVHDRLADLGSQLSLALIERYFLGKPIERIPQSVLGLSYCHKLLKQDTELLPNDSIDVKWGKIRAFSPNPAAFLIQDGHPIKIITAERQGDTLIPKIVKPEGKKAMSYDAYLLGHALLRI